MEQVIVIVGPTCSGKTQLSLELSEKLKTEILSADSRQIYKYLNIGTAKPSDQELKNTKHYFIDLLHPDEKFNVSDYESQAIKIIHKIHQRNKIPVVAGGSGLYIKALVDGIFNSVDSDPELREKLMRERKTQGNEYLYNKLKSVDPESASKMLPQNYKRIIRALEVYYLTGKPIGLLQKEYKREMNINFRQFGLLWDRKKLYENIESRVDNMIESGLVEEVRQILEKGYDKNLNSLNTVGYKEVIQYLEKEISLERAVELIKRNTRRFAKRQMTWFSGDERIKWFKIGNKEDLVGAACNILNSIAK